MSKRTSENGHAAKLVAIWTPAPVSSALSADQQVSLRHLHHFLGKYDKYLVAPEGSSVELRGIQTIHVPKKFFGSLAANNNLDYWLGLYEAFADYKYMFCYHLDSLAFSDQTEEWCSTNLDFIGPPYIRCADSPWVETPRVGNGGFALLKVESAMKVLRARHAKNPKTRVLDFMARNSARIRPLMRPIEQFQRKVPASRRVNGVASRWDAIEHPGEHNLNSDLFWSDRAVEYMPEFVVATLEQGLRFGFEVSPRTCFRMNGGRMPFGCHAWARYDRSFWEPFLLGDRAA